MSFFYVARNAFYGLCGNSFNFRFYDAEDFHQIRLSTRLERLIVSQGFSIEISPEKHRTPSGCWHLDQQQVSLLIYSNFTCNSSCYLHNRVVNNSTAWFCQQRLIPFAIGVIHNFNIKLVMQRLDDLEKVRRRCFHNHLIRENYIYFRNVNKLRIEFENFLFLCKINLANNIKIIFHKPMINNQFNNW